MNDLAGVAEELDTLDWMQIAIEWLVNVDSIVFLQVLKRLHLYITHSNHSNVLFHATST